MAEPDYNEPEPVVIEESFTGRIDLEFEGKQLYLDQDKTLLSVGRDEDNDLSVRNRYVSRHHCTIEFRRGRFVFTDTSSNGTYLVDADRQVTLVKGGKTFLPDKGLIGLGYRPDKPEAAVIRFRIADSS